jgi:hypothetical protein
MPMSTFQNILIVVFLVLFAFGLYDLQSRLERWDHKRHFSD